MKKLGKKLITLILTVSMFFGTGITNVFAYTLQEQQAEPTAERTESNNFDVVGWASHVYHDLNEIDTRIATITTKIKPESQYIIDINDKKNGFFISRDLVLDFSDPTNAIVNLDNGTKLKFIGNINDPGISIISPEGVSGEDPFVFYEKGAEVLKNFHDTKIKEMDEYLKSIEYKINVMEKLIDSNTNITNYINGNPSLAIQSIETITENAENAYNFILDHIDLSKITYNEETGVVNFDNALDPTIDWTINTPEKPYQDYLNYFKSLVSRLFDIQKNVKIFEDNKVLYDSSTYPEINGFDFETLKSIYDNNINELTENTTTPKFKAFKIAVTPKMNIAIETIKTKYNEINLKYTNDVDREITHNALTEILEEKGLSNLKYLFTVMRINDEDIKLFIDTFDKEYNRSKLSVDNTLAGLTINGIKLNVLKENQTLYLPYEVTTLDIETILSNSKATISIVKPTVLVVGKNIVKIIVTSESGAVKEYVITVIRKEEEKKEEKVTFVNNTVDNTISTIDTDAKKTEIKLDKEKDKYEENELADEKLSGWTVLLIVAGIGLIGFGVYLLFGDKATPLIVKKEVVKPRDIKPIKPEVKTTPKKKTVNKGNIKKK